MKAYERFNDGKMEDFPLSDEDLAKSLATLPKIG